MFDGETSRAPFVADEGVEDPDTAAAAGDDNDMDDAVNTLTDLRDVGVLQEYREVFQPKGYILRSQNRYKRWHCYCC